MDLKLFWFADEDYADRCNDTWPNSGVTVMLGNTALSASSKTQHRVTPYIRVAMAHGAKTALAIKAVLDFVQPHLSGRTIDMYQGNEGAKAFAGNS